MNGATAQADILGIFGVQALDMATRWGTPATNSPTYLAMKMYRNYDGLNSCFGDTSVSCAVPNPDTLSAFASQRTSDGALTVMVINKATTAALTYDASGLYNQIGATFTTPSGNQIQRDATDYKPFEAINNATANYSTVTADVLKRRQALKDAIASTTEALQSATTASEVQKLTGVLVGQNAALAATDKEIDQAVALSVEQDIENRNDAQKQAVAAQEQQKAEVVEAFSNYRTNFQLNTQPPMFPTGN